MARTGLLAIGLAAALTLTGCTKAGELPKDGVPIRSKAEVTAAVKAQADQIKTLIGKPVQSEKVDSQNCVYKKKENDGSVIVMQASYTVALPDGEHAAAAARVRDAWKAAGWKIGTDTTTGKSVELTGTGPDKVTGRVGSGEPAIALMVLVQSACFRVQDAA